MCNDSVMVSPDSGKVIYSCNFHDELQRQIHPTVSMAMQSCQVVALWSWFTRSVIPPLACMHVGNLTMQSRQVVSKQRCIVVPIYPKCHPLPSTCMQGGCWSRARQLPCLSYKWVGDCEPATNCIVFSCTSRCIIAVHCVQRIHRCMVTKLIVMSAATKLRVGEKKSGKGLLLNLNLLLFVG